MELIDLQYKEAVEEVEEKRIARLQQKLDSFGVKHALTVDEYRSTWHVARLSDRGRAERSFAVERAWITRNAAA